MDKKLSIVVPVYNEIKTLDIILNRIRQADFGNIEKEIIFVDDFSTDGSREFLAKIIDPDFKVFFHDKNHGKGRSLRTGFAQSTGDLVTIQDADLEYDPQDLKALVEMFSDPKLHVVYGSRYLEKDSKLKFWHSWMNKIFTKFSNLLTGQHLTDIMTCYKVFDRGVLQKILPLLESDRFGFEPEVTVKLSKLGYKIYEAPISYAPRDKDAGKHMNFKWQLESLSALIKYRLKK